MRVALPNTPPLSVSSRPSQVRRLIADRWPLLPIVTGISLLALPTLVYPFGPDQAIFATIGDAINRGKFPYVDAWDQKPPAIYLLYAAALHLPGPLMQRVRLFDLLWTLATLVALYELACVCWNPRAATFAALLYGAVYFTTQGWWYLAQPDGFAALPLTLALLCYVRARGRLSMPLCVVAGALIGAAFHLRFTVAPLLPALALLDAWGRREVGWALVRRFAWLGAGFLAVQALLAIYLLSGDALRAYIEATRFATGYTTLGWPFAPERRTLAGYLNYARGSFQSFVLSQVVLGVPAVAAAFAGLFLRPDPRVRQLTALALLGFLGIAAQQKFFWYHWQLLLPLMALLAGWAWDGMFGLIEARAGRGGRGVTAKALLVGGLLLASGFVTDGAYGQWHGYLHRNDTPISRVRYDNQFGGFGEGAFSYLADVQVSAYLRERTQPDDTIYVFGYDPLIYLLSERRAASRFIYSLPLMSAWAPRSWPEQFVAEIDHQRPVYFIVQRGEGAARWITGQTADTAAWAWKLEGIAARLERDYVEEIVIEDFTLYRRR